MITRTIRFEIEQKHVRYFIDVLSTLVITGKLSIQRRELYMDDSDATMDKKEDIYYVILRCKNRDFDRILNILINSVELGCKVMKLETH